MSSTSKTLSRLGIAGVAAVTMGAGLPVFLASSASAAPATSLVLNPSAGNAAAGTCQVFTVDARDANGNPATYDTATPTVRVEVTENPNNTSQTISFCDVRESANFANLTGAADTTEQNSAQTTSETAQREFTLARTAPSGGTVTSTTPTRATFGIRSNTTGGANIRAFLDTAPDNNAFDAGEIQVLGTSTFSAGGANTASNAQGGNAAQDAARTLTPGDTNSPVIAGQAATATVNVKNAAGDNVSGVRVDFRVTEGPNGPQTSSTGSTTAGASSTDGTNTFAVTDNAGNATIRYATNGTRTGTDTVQFFVNNTTGTTAGPDAGEPTASTTVRVAPAPVTDVAQARNIDLTPESVTTVAGASQVFVARVITASGAPVFGAAVTFREEGPGRFSNGSSEVTVNTNNAGEARVTTTSVAGETGTQIVTASITGTGNRTGEAAGTPAGTTRAGNNSDTATQTFTAPAPATTAPATSSPTATPTATATATPTGTASPRPTGSVTPPAGVQCVNPVGITLNREFIIPGVPVRVTVQAPVGAEVQLQAYSRPSTEYRVVRQGVVANSNGTVTFDVVPGTNTRLFANCVSQTRSASAQRVINVRTALSLTVVRNGARNYTFQGRILPRRAGQLITLYRVTNNGTRVLTSQIKTDSSGTYRINRRFTGSGTFGFLTRTGQTLTNAAGESTSAARQQSSEYLETGRGTSRPTAIF